MKKILLSLCLGLGLVWALPAEGAAEKAAGRPEANGFILIEPGLFRVTADDQKNFAAASVLPGRAGEFRRGAEGPAVHCGFTEQPLEFHWHKAAEGRGPENLALGYGEMSIKYADEQLVLQRYRGDFQDGFREGWGELLARELYSDGTFIYRGEFRQGRLEGRGVYISTDFRQDGEAPFIYEGEFQNDTFHGQGVMTDLGTGRILHSGLWFEGFPFEGSQAQWARASRRAGLEVRLAASSATAGSAGGK